jgi:predicted nuclease of predicted toxin-antitoxin system
VARTVRDTGANVIYHHDRFPEATPDDVWLAEAGSNGWIVLTKDSKLRYEPNARNAFIRARARVFCLVAGNLTAAEMGTAFTNALPAIEAFLARHDGPFIANLGVSGALTGTVYSG